MISVLVFIIVILAIAAIFLTLFKKPHDAAQHEERMKKAQQKQSGFCPVCNSRLFGSEKIISHVFEGGAEKDRRCNIIGCPQCSPVVKTGVKRVCPVCKKEIGEKGYLIARLFYRKDSSQHIHVVGCTECHKKT